MTPFEKAFAEARKAKKAAFEFKGKSYTTQLKGEAAGMTQRPKARPPETKAAPAAPAAAPRAKARPGAAAAATPGNTPPKVSSDAPKPPPAPTTPAPVKARPAADKPSGGNVITRLLSGKGGMSDQPASKPKAAPSSKGPSVSTVAKAIDYQGSGYTDVMKGGPRTPPAKKPDAAPKSEGVLSRLFSGKGGMSDRPKK